MAKHKCVLKIKTHSKTHLHFNKIYLCFGCVFNLLSLFICIGEKHPRLHTEKLSRNQQLQENMESCQKHFFCARAPPFFSPILCLLGLISGVSGGNKHQFFYPPHRNKTSHVVLAGTKNSRLDGFLLAKHRHTIILTMTEPFPPPAPWF